MAYWIIIDNYTTKIYKCSQCGSEYHDCIYSPAEWENCPTCKANIRSEEISPEATAIEPTPMKDVVILSIEKYDEMKNEIRSLKNELSIKEIEYKENIKHMTDLFVRIGISTDVWNKIDADSIEVLEDQNPYNYTTKYIIKFDAKRY